MSSIYRIEQITDYLLSTKLHEQLTKLEYYAIGKDDKVLKEIVDELYEISDEIRHEFLRLDDDEEE
jgi:hypothetical protein